MRSFSSSRYRADNLVSMPAGRQWVERISTLGFAAGVFIAVCAACASGYAQVNGMPNSPGRAPLVQAAQKGVSAQRAEVVGTAQRARIKITAQHVITPQRVIAPQHVQTAAAPVRTPLRAQRIALVRRPLSRPASGSTVGSHTAAKPTKLAIPKTATPVAAPAKTAMPIPTPELLAPAPQPDCTFDPARTDADDRQKLDYERQCYRHAEMIVRDRLERLQGDVEEMIKASKSTERVSASR